METREEKVPNFHYPSKTNVINLCYSEYPGLSKTHHSCFASWALENVILFASKKKIISQETNLQFLSKSPPCVWMKMSWDCQESKQPRYHLNVLAFLEFCDMHTARWGCERRQVREDNEAISGVFTFCQSEHWKVFITIIYITLKEKRFWNLLLV